jgi:hypothetical protein
MGTKMSTIVRLDTESDTLLRRLTEHSGRSRSEILREALLRFSRGQLDPEPDMAPHDLVEDLVGIAQGGPDDLARRHKQAFRELLARRAQR